MNFLKKVINLKRTLLSDDNEIFFNLLKKELPIKTHRFKSGTKCFDWEIPKKWTVKKGLVKKINGDIVINSKDSILHLVNYSCSFNKIVSLNTLKKHLHFDKKLPNAIPYRTSYYSKNWGICLNYQDYLKMNDNKYKVEIETKLSKGELIIGEAVIKGKSNKEIILSSYYCHPNQANDGLSGVALLIKLYNKMKNLNLNYTYRFFFWPETIGAITALSKKIINPSNVEYALIATTVGYGEKVFYKKTYLHNHSLDNIVKDFKDIHILDFTPTGSDERQFSSNGIRIPAGVLTLTPYEKYKAYHTSKDDLNLISFKKINQMSSLYLKILLEYEKYEKYKLSIKAGEPFLTKYKLYRLIGTPGNTNNDLIRNWILFYLDGTKNIKDISKLLNINESIIKKYIKKYKSKGLIQ